MKKFFKIALATIIAALCVATLAMTVAGAVPTGPAGVNFMALPAGSTPFTMATTYNVPTEDGNQSQNVIFRQDTQDYSQNFGYLNFINLPDKRVGNKFEVYFYFAEGGSNVLTFVNKTQTYYASAVLYWRVTGDDVTYRVMSSKIDFHMRDGTNYSLKPNVGTTNIDSTKDLEYMRITWDIPSTSPNENVVDCYMQFLQILQDREIDPNYLSGSLTATGYVPYNPQWFDGQSSYESGFSDGYADGTEEMSGGMIQRWGAFFKTALDGFLSFEIYPGFSLWGLLATIVAIPLLLLFLKLFLGG